MRKLAPPPHLASLLLAFSFLISVTLSPAFAQDWHGHDGHGHGDDWRWHGDIGHFHEYDYEHWRGGRWFNGFHEGRNGWWWIVDGYWYFYPAPIYPYPDPYTPPEVIVEAVPAAPVGMPPSYVYYCANPAGYYPYVPECFAPWRKVVTATVEAPPPVVAPAPVVAAAPAPRSVMPVAPAGNQRTLDDRQLNAFAVEFQKVDLNDRHARRNLENLETRVEAFRQALYQRNYNAMDILHDAENLQHRIAAQKDKLSKRHEAQETAPADAPPANAMMLPANPETYPASPAATPVDPLTAAPLLPSAPNGPAQNAPMPEMPPTPGGSSPNAPPISLPPQ